MTFRLSEMKRVLMVARKPTQEEFMEASKITGLGVLLIGVVGFLLMSMGYFILGGA
jgi:protein transport protein SEC61 subunit gamma-like protein